MLITDVVNNYAINKTRKVPRMYAMLETTYLVYMGGVLAVRYPVTDIHLIYYTINSTSLFDNTLLSEFYDEALVK